MGVAILGKSSGQTKSVGVGVGGVGVGGVGVGGVGVGGVGVGGVGVGGVGVGGVGVGGVGVGGSGSTIGPPPGVGGVGGVGGGVGVGVGVGVGSVGKFPKLMLLTIAPEARAMSAGSGVLWVNPVWLTSRTR